MASGWRTCIWNPDLLMESKILAVKHTAFLPLPPTPPNTHYIYSPSPGNYQVPIFLVLY